MTKRKTARITIEQRDIDSGYQVSSIHCPLARAANRQIPGVHYAQVGFTDLVMKSPDNHRRTLRLSLSRRARRFIHRFDNGKAVRPIAFRLPIVG